MKPLDPRLLRHAEAARRFVLLAALLAVVSAGLVLIQAQLLTDTVASAFLEHAGLSAVRPMLVGLLAVVAGRALLAWAVEVAAHRAAADVISRLRTALVERVLRAGPRRPGLPSAAELATLAGTGLDALSGYFSRYLPTLLVAAVVPVIVGARILVTDWTSALIIGLTVPLIPIFMILIGRQTEQHTRRQWRALAVLGHHFLDLVEGLDVLVAFGRARHQSSRLRTLAEQYRAATMRTLRVAFLSALVLELLATLSVALVAVSVGLRLVQGDLDLRTGLLVLVLAPEVYLPLRAVGARFHDCAAGLAAAQDAFAVLEPAAETDRRRRDGRSPAPDPSRLPLRVESVTVAGRGAPVLDGFDLTIEPGEVVAVTGASGAGKSTLVDLLLGLRSPDSGRVTVGGVDLADIDPKAWRRRVAWVPQRPMLLAGTVADNIRLSDPSADDERVRRAAAAAALELSPHAPVGPGGRDLSTGQRRRVALARAVLADRPLLVLDEPTEGVDADTERLILDALPALTAGRTVVVVTHRAELADRCDRRVVVPSTTQTRGPAGRPVPAAEPDRAGPTTAPATASGGTLPVMPGSEPVAPRSSGRTGVGSAIRWSALVTSGQRTRLAGAAGLGAAALGCGVALTATSAWLISSAALHPPVLTLMVAIVAVRAFGLGKGVLRYAERLVSHDAALRAGAALRSELWNALVRSGPALTARQRRGELLTGLITDVDAQQDLLIRALVPAAAAAVVGLATVAGLGAVLPSAGVAVAAGLLGAALLAPALSAWTARRAERHTARLRGQVAARTVETIEAAADLLVFGAAHRYLGQLRALDTQLTARARRAAVARGLGSGTAVLAIGVTVVATTTLGIGALRAGLLAGPMLAVLALTPLALGDVVAALPDAAVRTLSAVPSARRLAALLRAPAPVGDPPRPADREPARSVGALGLTVRWPGAPCDAVRDIGVHLAAGHRLMVTGPSGSGKSTLLAALTRTLAVRRGRILADGRDAAELTGEQLRASIGWCGPWTHLFDSTLRANLQLARPDAGDPALVEALRRAQLGRWFDHLPDGLDTLVGAHGTAVSGGERQRLGIARALLADRPILMLDEPTAHLDTPTATALADELTETTRDHTVLLVTHRPEQMPGLPQLRLARPTTPARTDPPTPIRAQG